MPSSSFIANQSRQSQASYLPQSSSTPSIELYPPQDSHQHKQSTHPIGLKQAYEDQYPTMITSSPKGIHHHHLPQAQQQLASDPFETQRKQANPYGPQMTENLQSMTEGAGYTPRKIKKARRKMSAHDLALAELYAESLIRQKSQSSNPTLDALYQVHVGKQGLPNHFPSANPIAAESALNPIRAESQQLTVSRGQNFASPVTQQSLAPGLPPQGSRHLKRKISEALSTDTTPQAKLPKLSAPRTIKKAIKTLKDKKAKFKQSFKENVPPSDLLKTLKAQPTSSLSLPNSNSDQGFDTNAFQISAESSQPKTSKTFTRPSAVPPPPPLSLSSSMTTAPQALSSLTQMTSQTNIQGLAATQSHKPKPLSSKSHRAPPPPSSQAQQGLLHSEQPSSFVFGSKAANSAFTPPPAPPLLGLGMPSAAITPPPAPPLLGLGMPSAAITPPPAPPLLGLGMKSAKLAPPPPPPLLGLKSSSTLVPSPPKASSSPLSTTQKPEAPVFSGANFLQQLQRAKLRKTTPQPRKNVFGLKEQDSDPQPESTLLTAIQQTPLLPTSPSLANSISTSPSNAVKSSLTTPQSLFPSGSLQEQILQSFKRRQARLAGKSNPINPAGNQQMNPALDPMDTSPQQSVRNPMATSSALSLASRLQSNNALGEGKGKNPTTLQTPQPMEASPFMLSNDILTAQKRGLRRVEGPTQRRMRRLKEGSSLRFDTNPLMSGLKHALDRKMRHVKMYSEENKENQSAWDS